MLKKIVILFIIFFIILIPLKNNNINFPNKFHIINFPILTQPDEISCGPTSLKMLFAYIGKDITIEDIKKEAHTEWIKYGDNRIGLTTPYELKNASDKLGLKTTLQTIDLNELKYYISRKKFPIVLLRSGEKYWHWVVAIGYDRNNIIISDPCGLQYKINNEIFENAWNFNSDMRGNNYLNDCPLCENGYIYPNIGPIGKCDQCGGTGKIINVYKKLILWSGINANTAIVPNLPLNQPIH